MRQFLFAFDDFKFSKRQLGFVERLVAQYGAPTFWEPGHSCDLGGTRFVVVVEPPHGVQSEELVQGLRTDVMVVVPFGENSGFDHLKSKLVGYGTHSSAGKDGAHQLWWGGHDPLPRSGGESTPLIIVSAYSKEVREPAEVVRLRASLQSLGLTHHIEPVDFIAPGRLVGSSKVDFILQQWENASGPILWVDRGASIVRAPEFPEATVCDVAIHKAGGWAMSTNTLYFAKTQAAEALLRTWKQLANSFPETPDWYLLDQAWSLVNSQMDIATVWLPQTFNASSEYSGTEKSVVAYAGEPTDAPVVSDFPARWRTARRNGRTGAPEPQIVLHASHGAKGPLMVLVDVSNLSSARRLALTLEQIVDAYTLRPGGFSQIELSICGSLADLKGFVSCAEEAQIPALVIDPSTALASDIFENIGSRVENAPSTRIYRIAAGGSAAILQYARSRHIPGKTYGLQRDAEMPSVLTQLFNREPRPTI